MPRASSASSATTQPYEFGRVNFRGESSRNPRSSASTQPNVSANPFSSTYTAPTPYTNRPYFPAREYGYLEPFTRTPVGPITSAYFQGHTAARRRREDPFQTQRRREDPFTTPMQIPRLAPLSFTPRQVRRSLPRQYVADKDPRAMDLPDFRIV